MFFTLFITEISVSFLFSKRFLWRRRNDFHVEVEHSLNIRINISTYKWWPNNLDNVSSQNYLVEIFFSASRNKFSKGKVLLTTAVHCWLKTPIKLTSHGMLHYLWSADLSKLFFIDYINIYRSQHFFSINFARSKTVGLPRIVYIVIH